MIHFPIFQTIDQITARQLPKNKDNCTPLFSGNACSTWAVTEAESNKVVIKQYISRPQTLL